MTSVKYRSCNFEMDGILSFNFQGGNCYLHGALGDLKKLHILNEPMAHHLHVAIWHKIGYELSDQLRSKRFISFGWWE